MTTRIAALGLAGLLLTGICTTTASARDFEFNLSIGRDRAYYVDSCYSPRVVRTYSYDYDYDCAPVVRPCRTTYYYRDCGPVYYRPVRVYSARSYYVSPRSHHRSVSVDVGRRGGRVYYRH